MIGDPVQQVRYSFSRAGRALRAEVWADPGGGAPILHLHPNHEERFEVLQGEVTLRLDGRDVVLRPEETAVAPRSSRHRFVNTGTTTAHLVVTIDPALQMQECLTDAARLARDGCYTRQGVPRSPTGALRLAHFAQTYRDTLIIVGGAAPPPAWQPAMFAPMAWLAERLHLHGDHRN